MVAAWMNGHPAPAELTDRLPDPGPEFFARVMERAPRDLFWRVVARTVIDEAKE